MSIASRHRSLLTFLAVLAATLLLASTAQAQYVVNTFADGADLVPGDGLCLTAAGTCSLRAAIQDGNAAPGPNGAILGPGTYVLSIGGTGEDASATGDLDITDNFLIEGDRAVTTVIDGGGVDRVLDHRSGGLTLKRVTIRNGNGADGGGVRAANLLILEDVVIRNNTAAGNGGGLWVSSPAQILRSTFAHNRAFGQGGGLYLTGTAAAGSHAISDTTISTNFATVSGGGVVLSTGVAALVTHATLHQNAAPTVASILVDASATLTLRNSIVSAGSDSCGGAGTIADQGGSLASVACGNVTVSPGLNGTIEPLALYHPPFAPGPVLGHGLTPASPAVGAALATFCTPIDQRGLERGGTCDSGAFEFHPTNGPYNASPTTLTLTPVSDKTIQTGTSTNDLLVTALYPVGSLDRLEFSASSSTEALVPSSGIRVTQIATGVWNVRVLAAADRTGIAVVTLAVTGFAPDEQAISRFAVTVVGADGQAGGGTPAAARGPGPTNVIATPSGSGAIVTWTPSTAPGVRQYAVAGGRVSGGTSMPVLLTAGTETSMTLPSLPAGNYVFRVYAIGTYGVSAPSAEAPLAATSTEAPGSPYGVTGEAIGLSVQINGRPPTFGAPPSAYIVEFGTAPGRSNVASVMPTAAPFAQPLGNGFYWVQARAVRGAFIGVPSSSFGVLVGPPSGGCLEEPHPPVLLPPATNGPTATLTWLRAEGGPSWRSFRLERLNGPHGIAVDAVNLQTQATVYVADLAAGTYYYRVLATNGCGVGGLSNSVAVTIGGAQ